MPRVLPVLLVFIAACGRPPSGSPPPPAIPKPASQAAEPPPIRAFRDDFGRARKFVPDGPLRRGPYVQAVSSTRATVCLELVEAGEAKATCDGKTVAGAWGLRHELTFQGLKPATRYSYTVEPGGRTGSFKTSPDGDSDLFFVAWGDSRTYYDKLARISELVAKDQPDFTVHSGDLVDDGHVDDDWDRFFESAAPLLRSGALWPSIGNHDYGAKQYFDLFVLPEPESWYTFTAGPAQFFILDSNWTPRKDPKQIAWFAEEVKKSKARFKFLVCHHPLVSCPDDDFAFDKEWSMYGLFGKALEEAGVVAVFQGHNHNYQRAERKGVVYITTGGGGAPLYDVGPLTPETKFAREVHHYVRVRLTGRKMSLETVDIDGQVIDRAEKTVP
jgi:acid phosphatase type 7